jgi:two-component sensor histidine kinase
MTKSTDAFPLSFAPPEEKIMTDLSDHNFVTAVVRDNRDSEDDWLRQALAAAQMGTWQWNILTGEIKWSDNLEAIHGMASGSFDGTFGGYLQILHPDDRNLFQQAIREAIENRTDFSVEFRIFWPDRSIHWIMGKGRVFYTETGQPVRMVGLGMDITARHEAEHQIAELNSRLHRAIYESSHRIKNHLQILAATVDIALMDAGDLIPSDQFRRVGAQIRTLSMLQDILTVEWKADATGTVETISSRAILEKVLDIMRQAASGNLISFTIADTSLPMRTAMTLALIANEAVANAVKHGKQGVEVKFQVKEEIGVLEVCDDGPGFPEGFDPQTAANTGLELILSLVTHDLRGTVYYENRVQGGARVAVLFPIHPNN